VTPCDLYWTKQHNKIVQRKKQSNKNKQFIFQEPQKHLCETAVFRYRISEFSTHSRRASRNCSVSGLRIETETVKRDAETQEVQPPFFIGWFPNHHYFGRGENHLPKGTTFSKMVATTSRGKKKHHISKELTLVGFIDVTPLKTNGWMEPP